MMSVLVSLFAYLAFETPLAVIQKLLFENLLAKPRKTKSALETKQRNETHIDNGKLS